MLDAVFYVEAKKTHSIVAVRPKPPFRPIFQVAASHADADVKIINEPPGALPEGSPLFLVETGESWPLPETRVLCFI
jgi:site-specific DNA recombinase